MAIPTLLWSVQIIQQAWAEPPLEGDADCRERAATLAQALDAARVAARAQEGERDSLRAFRAELGPAWGKINTLQARCEGPKLTRWLHEIEQLRYAEEHAVRYEARELTERRQRVARLQRELGIVTAPLHDGSHVRPGN